MRISTIGACLLLAAAAVLTTQPWAPYRQSPWKFEARLESNASGLVQLYYDLGDGIHEEQSAVRAISAGVPATLSFPLPCGRIRLIRFDPLDRACTMSVSDARVLDGSGHPAAAIRPEQFQPQFQIDAIDRSAGRLRVVTTPGESTRR